MQAPTYRSSHVSLKAQIFPNLCHLQPHPTKSRCRKSNHSCIINPRTPLPHNSTNLIRIYTTDTASPFPPCSGSHVTIAVQDQLTFFNMGFTDTVPVLLAYELKGLWTLPDQFCFYTGQCVVLRIQGTQIDTGKDAQAPQELLLVAS